MICAPFQAKNSGPSAIYSQRHHANQKWKIVLSYLELKPDVAYLVYYCGWLIASSQHICCSPHDSFGAGNSNMISILQATLKCYCLSCTTVKKIMRRTWRITQMDSPSGFDTPLTILDCFILCPFHQWSKLDNQEFVLIDAIRPKHLQSLCDATTSPSVLVLNQEQCFQWKPSHRFLKRHK